MAPIIYGLILAYLMTPLLNAIENKWIYPVFDKKNWWINDKKRDKHIRMLSITLTILCVLLFLYLFFASVIPQLYQSIKNLLVHYSSYTSNLVSWLYEVMEDNPDIANILSNMIYNYSSEANDFLDDVVLPALQTYLLPNVSDILTNLSASIMKIVMFVWNIIIGLIISIYVLSSKEKFAQGCVRMCYAILETKSANKFISAVRFTHHTFIGFLSGKVVDSAIIGVLCYICCLLMKMPYALLVSVIVGVTNVIPFFGPYIGAIPSIIIILLVDPKKALTFAIFILILQQFDGNFLGPMILSQSTGLTSFWIIFAITLFGGLFGVIGMIIGVPVTAVIAAFIQKHTDEKLKKKNLPTEPEKYYEVGEVTEEGEFTHYEYIKPKMKTPNKNSAGYKLLRAIGEFLKKIIIFIFEWFKAKIINIKGKIHDKKETKEKENK